jgi:LysR family transcriptional regulator, transcriptional activator of nhaA
MVHVEWLNYHHLLYFWVVVREGSITQACEKLHLAQPTISSQLKKLERNVGAKLFERSGRQLVLTDTGHVVYRYADEIFSLGRELQDAVRGRAVGRPLRFMVGVPDVLPKMIVYRLLRPAFELPEPIQLVCHEGKLDQLLVELSLHQHDIVISDSPVGTASPIRAFNHLLGESPISIFGKGKTASQYRRNFPKSLDGAPMLLPTTNTTLRRALDQWCEAQDIRPHIVAEFEDSALLKVFGKAGDGLFAAPTAIEEDVKQQYQVTVIGRVPEVRERFYAISVERRLKHPAVLAISSAAREDLFNPQTMPTEKPV